MVAKAGCHKGHGVREGIGGRGMWKEAVPPVVVVRDMHLYF